MQPTATTYCSAKKHHPRWQPPCAFLGLALRGLLSGMLATALYAGHANADPGKPAAPDKAVPDKAAPDKAAPDKAAPSQETPAAPAAEPAPQSASGDDKPATDADSDKPKPATAAPTAEDIEQAKAHYLKGSELFDLADYAGAIGEFKTSYRLSRNPFLLYNIAWTNDKLNDKQRALLFYEKFLRDAPEEAPNREVATTRAKILRRQLNADEIFAGNPQARRPKKTEPAKPASPTEFVHEPVEETPPARPLDITAFVPEGVKWQITLFYRTPGENSFSATGMKLRYKEMVGRIPATKTRGTTVQYYVEVKDRSGKIVARSGKRSSPHIVFIEENARARYYPDFGERDGTGYKPSGDNPEGKPQIRRADYAPGEPIPEGTGTFDVGSSKFRIAKVGTSIGAVALLGTGIASYFIASQAATDLEGEEVASRTGTCTAPPCTQFADLHKDLQSRGKTFQTVYRVSMGLGVATAAVAGYLWYKDIQWRDNPRNTASLRSKPANRVAVTPLIDDKFVGAGALFSF